MNWTQLQFFCSKCCLLGLKSLEGSSAWNAQDGLLTWVALSWELSQSRSVLFLGPLHIGWVSHSMVLSGQLYISHGVSLQEGAYQAQIQISECSA